MSLQSSLHIMAWMGGWRVQRTGSSRGRAFGLKRDAIKYARVRAAKYQWTIYIHRADGAAQRRVR